MSDCMLAAAGRSLTTACIEALPSDIPEVGTNPAHLEAATSASYRRVVKFNGRVLHETIMNKSGHLLAGQKLFPLSLT